MTEGILGKRKLESVQEERDLGLIIRSDLKSVSQCKKSAATARRVIGMVRRQFKQLDTEDFQIIYKTYIRPHLEYCIQAWSPHLVKDIAIFENVQKAATNLVPKLRKYSYQVRLQKLGLTTVKDRRERGDLIEVYKLLTGREQIDYKQFFTQAHNHYDLRVHGIKLIKERTRLDTRKFYFSQRLVNGWNRLPATVVNAETVNAFKNDYVCSNYVKDMDIRSR